MLHGPALWVALVAGGLYFLVMIGTAGRRYDLLRPRFFVYSGPGVLLEGAVPVYLLLQFRLLVPVLALAYLSGRTIRIERERGENKPFISTLQLWPLELTVLLVLGGVEYLVSGWLGLSTSGLL
jgi:hypothetical protein